MPIASLIMAAAAALLQGAPPPPVPARAEEAQRLSLSYTMTIFSIPFGHIDYAVKFAAARYDAEMHFRTSGVAAVLWKANIDAAVEGRVAADGRLVPALYTTQSVSRRGARQSVRVVYGGKDGPVMTAVPPYDLSRAPVSEAQKRGAVDPLTAISSLIGSIDAGQSEPCSRTLAIFDGRRRYDMVFTPAPQVVGTAGNSDAKPRVCKAEYRQLAGLKQDVVDVASVPAIYVEFVDTPTAGRRYTVARTMWSSFLWGAVSATLTEARLDGRTLAFAR